MLMRSLLIINLILLSGCIQLPLRPATEPEPATAPSPTQNAEIYEAQGNYSQAAQEYLRLAAQTNPPTRQLYQLSAIRAYLKADQIDNAKAEWSRFNIQQSFGLQVPLQIVYAKFSLAEQRLEQAASYLNSLGDIRTLDRRSQADYHEIYAQILETQHKYLDAAQQRIILEQLLPPQSAILLDNQKQLWNNLRRLSPNQLAAMPRDGSILSGWIELANLSKTIYGEQIQAAINQWQNNNPNHPANNMFVARLIEEIRALPPQPRQVALLLPLSGRFQLHAEAIRDGFLLAAHELSTHSPKPNISVHNITPETIKDVYQMVVNDGAELIVGPLQKDSIENLTRQITTLPVPTLVLNHVAELPYIANLYQFSLSPENEAQEVAEKAWQDGHRTALALVPQDSWGSRVLQAFQQAWQQRGGRIALSQTYTQDIAQAIGFIAQSKVQADMTFMAAYPQFARLLQPFLRRDYSAQIPIYSTSHVYSANFDSMDVDLEGVIFGDMPWVLAPNTLGQRMQQKLVAEMPDKFMEFKRLFGFGIDAYALVSHLQHLSKQPYSLLPGQTGQLFMDNQQRVWRKLVWAYFKQGKPELINSNDSWMDNPVPSIPNHNDNPGSAISVPVPVEPAIIPLSNPNPGAVRLLNQ